MIKHIPSKYVAAGLGVFGGVIGLHHFYMGKFGVGIVFLLVSLITSFTVVIPLVIAIIGALQGVSYLFWGDKEWANRFE